MYDNYKKINTAIVAYVLALLSFWPQHITVEVPPGHEVVVG